MYYNLLQSVSLAMKQKGYCLPPEVQGVHTNDTGAVIAVVLYFIMKEPKINKKKIKCYLLLLNRICQYKGKGDIFRWELDEHFIQKFIDALIDFMKKRKLIRLSGNSKSQLVVYEVPTFFTEILPLIPPNVVYWLNTMLNVCKNKKGNKMENAMLHVNFLTNDGLIAMLQATINKNTQAYIKKQSGISSNANEVLMIVEKCLELIDEHEANSKN